MIPDRAGLYWARLWGDSLHAVVRVVGHSPFLDVDRRYIDLSPFHIRPPYLRSDDLCLQQVEEWGPRIDVPTNEG